MSIILKKGAIITNTRHSLSESVFFLALFIWTINSMLASSALFLPQAISWFTKFSVIVLLALKLLIKRKYKVKEFVLIIIMILMTLIVYLTGGYNNLILVIALIVSADGIEFKKIVKWLIIEMVFITAFLFALSQAGIIEDYTYNRIIGTSISTAHSYGFLYYSMIASVAFVATISYCYLRKRCCSYLELFILAIINIILYKFHTARLPMLLAIMFIISYIIVFKFEWINMSKKLWLFIATVLPIILFLGSGGITALYGLGNFRFHNSYFDTLNSRLVYSVIAFEKYGIHLFGTQVKTAGMYSITYGHADSRDAFFIDNGYIYTIIAYGVLFSVLQMFLYILIYRYIYKTNDRFCFLWLGIMMVGNLVYDFLFNPLFNPILFLIPQAIKGTIRSHSNRFNNKTETKI